MPKKTDRKQKEKNLKLFAIICEGNEGLIPPVVFAENEEEAKRLGSKECAKELKALRGVYETTWEEIREMQRRQSYFEMLEDEDIPAD